MNATLTDGRGHARAIEYARTLGHEDGMSAATIGPEAEPDLSGEWADSLTGPILTENALLAAGMTRAGILAMPAFAYDDMFTDLCDAYEEAFTEAVRETWPETYGARHS